MKPFLCDGSAVDKSLKSIIQLNDCTECTVEEELNGKYECTIKLPSSSIYSGYLVCNRFVLVKPNTIDEPQFFRIYQISKELSSEIVIKCEHIRYLLNDYICPFDSSNTLQGFFNNINGRIAYTKLSFPFTLASDFDKTMNFSFFNNVKSIGEALAGSENSIIDNYGGELFFNNYVVWLMKNRGKNKNVVLQYGYDIMGYSSDVSNTESYTHVFPYYLWGLSDGDNAIITLSNKSITNKYPTLKAADFIKIDNNYIEGKTSPRIYKVNLAEIYNLDISAGYDSFNISSLAENWINVNKAKLIGINATGKVNFATIQNNIALNKCLLGDVVRVRIPNLKIETQEKIVKTTYDSINEYYISLEIGNIKQKLDNKFVALSQSSKQNANNISKVPSLILSKGGN